MSKSLRYFTNKYRLVYQGGKYELDHEHEIEESLKSVRKTLNHNLEKIKNDSPPEKTESDGGLYVGSVGFAYTFLHLIEREYFDLDNKREEYIKLSESYLFKSLQNMESKNHRPDSSFLLGDAGTCAVGAAIFTVCTKSIEADNLLKLYINFSKNYKKMNFLSCGSDEFFVGRAGYIFGALWLNKKLGKSVVPLEILHELCRVTVESGKSYSQRNSSSFPLMYSYYETEYLGAAHGISTILQVLIQVPNFLNTHPEAEKLVKQSVDYILTLETSNGNFPCAMDEIPRPRREKDELVHWCHGAPGVIYLIAASYLRWKDERYLNSCLRAGELVWEKGLLKKGPGICHGVAGNGYVFLLLYRLTLDRLHLYRAVKFAEFLNDPEFIRDARKPDSPYSLYEGIAGTACFLADVLQPEKAAFPFQDIF